MNSMIVFTEEDQLLQVVENNFPNKNYKFFSFNVHLDDIDLTDKIILIDYDNDKVDTKEFLSSVAKKCGDDSKILILSVNCERKVVADTARRGADRFIVKPLNRKRFKNIILTYLSTEIEVESESVTEVFY